MLVPPPVGTCCGSPGPGGLSIPPQSATFPLFPPLCFGGRQRQLDVTDVWLVQPACNLWLAHCLPITGANHAKTDGVLRSLAIAMFCIRSSIHLQLF